MHPALEQFTPNMHVRVIHPAVFERSSCSWPIYLYEVVPVGAIGRIVLIEDDYACVQFFTHDFGDGTYWSEGVIFYAEADAAGVFEHPLVSYLEPTDAEIAPIELGSQIDPVLYAQEMFRAKYSGMKLALDTLRSSLDWIDAGHPEHFNEFALEGLLDCLIEIDEQPFVVTERVLRMLFRIYYHPAFTAYFGMFPELKACLAEILRLGETNRETWQVPHQLKATVRHERQTKNRKGMMV